MDQRLKERLSEDYTPWESIPYTITKPRRYCSWLEVLADGSQIWLSLERLFQSLTKTEAEAHSQPLD